MKLKKSFLLQRYPFRLLLLTICSTSAFFILKFVRLDLEKSFLFTYEPVAKGLLVDTPGCEIPSWNTWDPSVKKFYKPVQSYKCPGVPSFLSVKPNAVVSLDDTVLQLYYEASSERVSCIYGSIYRSGKIEDFTIDEKFEIGPMKTLVFDTPLNENFIKTECLLVIGEEKLRFEEYLPLTPLMDNVESRCEKYRQKNERKPLNVIFLGIDSVSTLNFIRHFPKTNDFMLKHMSPLTLKGYTKVGDNTFPNIVPLLTGQFYEAYWNETTNKTMYFDDVPFLWKEFSKLGYRTLLAEDAPAIATFNYFRSGFKNPPVDYYFRPFALAVENAAFRSSHCIGHKMEMQVVYDYFRSFMQTMNHTRPFFAFVFVARLTHDVLNNAGYADEPTFELMRFLYESHFLNNTLLVFFSDHGIRFSEIRQTLIGRYEERMPFMNLIFPKTFLKQHEQIAQNLKTNQRRLTTPFDIHATVLDLVNICQLKVGDESVIDSRSISLFREISPHRTCQHAAIPSHYCTCQIQTPVSLFNKSVVHAATVIVSTINDWIKRLSDKCSNLTLHKIHTARVSRTNRPSSIQVSVKDTTLRAEYLVVVSTSPGLALFEATVRCEVENAACFVVGDVSRINRYGNQSSCITDTVLKKYCYCFTNAA